MKILTSVIVPSYNAAGFLGPALRSVLEQDCESFEVLVVDDASTDDTPQVIAGFDDPRLRYERLPRNHGGPSRPRNVGIDLARGRYIAMLDSDDLMLPGALKRRVEFVERFGELGLVFCDGVRFDEAGERDGTYLDGYNHFLGLDKQEVQQGAYIIEAAEAYRGMIRGDFTLPSGSLIPRAVYDRVGAYDESLTNGADADMCLRITREFSIGFLDFIGFRQRVHEQSITRRGARLAFNRIAVLQKQLDGPLDAASRSIVRYRMAQNYFGLGYSHQVRGEMTEARRFYLQSLRWRFYPAALKGVAISLLGRRLYRALKGEDSCPTP